MIEVTAEVYKENDKFVVKIYEKKMIKKEQFETYAQAVKYIEKVSEEL